MGNIRLYFAYLLTEKRMNRQSSNLCCRYCVFVTKIDTFSDKSRENYAFFSEFNLTIN